MWGMISSMLRRPCEHHSSIRHLVLSLEHFTSREPDGPTSLQEPTASISTVVRNPSVLSQFHVSSRVLDMESLSGISYSTGGSHIIPILDSSLDSLRVSSEISTSLVYHSHSALQSSSGEIPYPRIMLLSSQSLVHRAIVV